MNGFTFSFAFVPNLTDGSPQHVEAARVPLDARVRVPSKVRVELQVEAFRMRLENAQVVFFRNILDSQEVEVQPDVTCLVGKNESGKTSFLSALHVLNPAVPAAIDLKDYPAWLSKGHRLDGRILEDETPIRATFVLEPQEIKDVAAEFGPSVQEIKSVIVRRAYSGDLEIDMEFDEAAWTQEFVAKHCEDLLDGSSTPARASELGKVLDAIVAKAPEEGEPDSRPAAKAAKNELVKACGPQLQPEKKVLDWVQERLPKFLYVGRYHTLPDKIEIQRVASANYESLGDNDRIAKSLLELSSADTKLAMGADYERRKRELNDTANALTQEIPEYWSQNENIRVEIDYDQAIENAQPIVKHLHVRLYDSEHMVSLPFGERSSGFQWFFSFLCAFSRYRQSGRPVVLLLDEPALGLHATAQRDFLRYIDEKLSGRCQVVYTTHSPFMVNPARMERVRPVEDRGRKHGAAITRDVLTTDRDTIFPLQGAIGYDLAQNLFVGPYNLIVEGVSDLAYLQVLSRVLGASGRQALDERCTIVPVGGVGQIATFVALLGRHVDATVLIDSTKQGNQRLDQLLNQGLLRKSRVIGIGEITKQQEADIEDLFSVGEYLALFNEAFGKTYKESDLNGADPVVRRLARAEGKDRFDHGRPADVLMRKAKPKFSKSTLDNFEQLFARINSTLPQ